MTATVWTCGAPERATTRSAASAIVASCVTTTMVTWTGHHVRLFARALDMASDLQREGVTPDARAAADDGLCEPGEDISNTRWNLPSSAPSLSRAM